LFKYSNTPVGRLAPDSVVGYGRFRRQFGRFVGSHAIDWSFCMGGSE
jgi:hypothetical protein